MVKRPILAGLLLALTMLAGSERASAATAVVRPDPLTSSVQPGQTFVVNLYLQDVTAAYGADVRMCFDPTLVEVQDADSAMPGIQIQPLSAFMEPGFVIKHEAQNVPDAGRNNCKTGGMVWYAFTQLNPTEPKTGSGPIAAVTFKALKAGESPLTIEYKKVADRYGAEVPTTAGNGLVRISGAILDHRVLLPLIRR